MNIDKLKQYISSRLDTLLTQDVYTSQPKYDTTNDPENAVTEPYVLINNFTMVEQSYNKYKYLMELSINDFTADSTTVNTIAKNILAELNKSWQTESDMFFRTDIDWSGDIPAETPDKSRIDQRYEINVREIS